MFFITRELYRKLRDSEDKEALEKYLNKEHLRVTNYPIGKGLMEEMILEMEIRDLVYDIKNAYYVTTSGIINEIIKRFEYLRVNKGLKQVVWENSKLYVTAIIDIMIWHGWNGVSSVEDLAVQLSINDATYLHKVYDISQECVFHKWLNIAYEAMYKVNVSEYLVFDLRNYTHGKTGIGSLEYVYDLINKVYESLYQDVWYEEYTTGKEVDYRKMKI